MNKTLLPLVLALIAGQAMAMEPMELAIDAQPQLNMPDTTEQKVVITIEDQEIELPARYSSLSGILAGLTNAADVPTSTEFYKEGTPLPQVSLAAWQLIEKHLERVYRSTHGETQSRDEIIADYSQLDRTSLIDLIGAVDYLDIPLLREITLELAQIKLTLDEILQLSPDILNEVIKRKALAIAGPVVLKELAVFGSHHGWVHSVCVTPDNKIVSGSTDTTVRVWDRDGKQLAVCRGHTEGVWSVCVTHDNKIVSGSQDTTVRIWNRDGQELAVCRGHDGPVRSVCVTPDNKIISGSDDTTVRIWNMNGQELAVCWGHQGWVNSVCVTQDNKIVSGSDDRTVRIWVMNGQELAVCRGHQGWVNSVCVTHDNKIVSGSDDGTLRIWDMAGNEQAVCRGHENAVRLVCVTPDNKIVSGSYGKTMLIRDMDGQELAVCKGHGAPVNSVCVTRDNKIVSGSDDKTVRIWDRSDITLHDRLSGMSENQAEAICKILQSATDQNLNKEQTWKEIAKIFEEEELPKLSKWRSAGAIKPLILPVSFLIAAWVLYLWKKQKEQGKKEIPKILEGQELVSETQKGLPAYMRNEVIKRKALKIAGPVVLKELAIFRGNENWVSSVCVTQDNKIVSGSYDKTVRIWDMDGQQLRVCQGHEDPVSSVCITQDNKIISGSYDKTVRIWDMDGQQLAVCKGHEDPVSSVCITQDNKIISGSHDSTMRIWNIAGEELAVCRCHQGPIRSVWVTPDNKIVSGSYGKTMRIRDMDGQQLAVCKGHEAPVNSVCVTPDNKIVSGSDDGTVRIWDMAGQELAVCRGHKSGVSSVCVTPDNKIVSGSYDKTVRIWDMDGQQLAVGRGHEKSVRSVCVTQDNKIVSGSEDGTVRIWDRSDITLHDRLSGMSENQAEAICKILQSATDKNLNKEQTWRKIAKIFEEEELPKLSKWHSAGAKKVANSPCVISDSSMGSVSLEEPETERTMQERDS